MTLRTFLLLSLLPATGCHRGDLGKGVSQQTAPARDINLVLRGHDEELMAIPGVVGVYVGLHTTRQTPCLKVMAARLTPALQQAVPKLIEGYPVEIEETGVIRPMTSQ